MAKRKSKRQGWRVAALFVVSTATMAQTPAPPPPSSPPATTTTPAPKAPEANPQAPAPQTAPSQPPTAPQNVPPPPPVNRGSQPNISGVPADKKAADAKVEPSAEKKSN